MPRQPSPATDPHSERVRHVIGMTTTTITQDQVRDARRAYYGSVAYVDDQVGGILATLEDARLDEDTIVIVLADHGDMLGERGLWYKMSFFDPACRVPLIVHAPQRFAPRRVGGSASLLDLLPTLAELGSGGVPLACPSSIGGRSLVPALRGEAQPDEVIGEYLAEGAIAPVVMIRRDGYKFIHCPADPDQLYDLGADPQELDNLATSAAHAGRVAAFRAEVTQRWSLDALHAAVLASQQQRRFVYAALREGRFTPWDHQPLRDASKLYIRNDQELNDLEAMARFPR